MGAVLAVIIGWYLFIAALFWIYYWTQLSARKLAMRGRSPLSPFERRVESLLRALIWPGFAGQVVSRKLKER